MCLHTGKMDEVTKKIRAYSYAEMRAKVAPWAPDTDDGWIQDCIARCVAPTGAWGPNEPTGTQYFASTFFPKAVQGVFTPERIKYLELLDDDTIPYLYALTHRGFAKTTLGVFAIMRALITRKQKFVLFTSAIYDVAAKRTEAIRAGICMPDIALIFGDLKPRRGEHVGANFSEEAFMLINPDTDKPMAVVQPRGSEQVVNGSLIMMDGEMVRPTMIFSDDGQKRLHIDNGELRDRYADWWDSEVEPVVQADAEPDLITHRWPVGGPCPFRFVVVDTCKHNDAHIMRIAGNPRWTGVTFPIAESVDGKIKIKHKIITQRQLDSRVERHRYKMDVFYREYMCRPSSAESRIWTTDMYRRYREGEKDFSDAFKFIVIDPARSVGHKAAFTSILGVAIKPDEGIFLRENIVARLTPDEYYRETFAMARRLKTRLILPEETGLALVIKNAFHQAASLAGLSGQVEFDWLQSRRNPGVEYGTGEDAIKKARCISMFPYYEQRVVWHSNVMDGGPLERAQLQYPDCVFWDATDTAGYIPEIMERYSVFLDARKEGTAVDTDYEDDFEEAGAFFRSREWCS